MTLLLLETPLKTPTSLSCQFCQQKKKPKGPNYMAWMRNLKVTLRYKNKEYVLEKPSIKNIMTTSRTKSIFLKSMSRLLLQMK